MKETLQNERLLADIEIIKSKSWYPAIASKIRNDALEEAAKECEALRDIYSIPADEFEEGCDNGLDRARYAIRALKKHATVP